MSASTQEVAKAFCRLLHKELGEKSMAIVVARNKVSRGLGDMNACATHDFCDSNVLMESALEECGVVVWKEGEMPDEVNNLFNAAWTLAKRCDFEERRVGTDMRSSLEAMWAVETNPVLRHTYALAKRLEFDWFNTESMARRMAEGAAAEIHTADVLLERADRFIAGFEDDETQVGVKELLQEIRAFRERVKI